jgi:HicB_like antitoxin of bacterial toxin-antitoxin system
LKAANGTDDILGRVGERHGGFGVFFPDLDGCITLGETAAEAAENAREALSLHIEAYLLVWADTHAGERVNVYLPKSLLERVDRFVSAAGMNRSSFFGLAARRMLDQEKGKTIG